MRDRYKYLFIGNLRPLSSVRREEMALCQDKAVHCAVSLLLLPRLGIRLQCYTIRMQRFRSFVRAYADGLRQLDKLRTLLLQNGNEQELRATVQAELQSSADELSVRIIQLKEFLLANGSFQTDGELGLLVGRRLLTDGRSIELESYRGIDVGSSRMSWRADPWKS